MFVLETKRRAARSVRYENDSSRRKRCPASYEFTDRGADAGVYLVWPGREPTHEWAADVFALANVILERTEAYRFVLSPLCGMEWPPRRFFSSWSDAVDEASRQWSVWVEDQKSAFAGLLAEEWSLSRERAGMPLEDLAEGCDWRMCEALLTIHAIADVACAGLGLALDRSDGKACIYRARGRELLARTGSLARIRSHFVRVMPKVRTPPNGTSLRSFSRYACVHGPSVDAKWHKVPVRRGGTAPHARHDQESPPEANFQ